MNVNVSNKIKETAAEATVVNARSEVNRTISNLCKLINEKIDSSNGDFMVDGLPELVTATSKMIESFNSYID